MGFFCKDKRKYCQFLYFKHNGPELAASPVYRNTGCDSSLSYLFAAPFQEQASLVYIDDDNAVLEVDDKQQLFRCYTTKQIGTNPP